MTYADDRINEKRIINEIAEKVAQTMGWEVQTDSQPLSDQGIIRKDEKSLYFRLDWRDKTRLEISGGFNGCAQYLPYHDKREKTEITVSRDKPIEKIVKDIQGRLLPGYEKMLAYALEMKAKDNEFTAKKQADLEEIAGLVKGATIQDEKVWSYKPHLTCKHWLDGDWELTTTLTKEKLKAVLAIINEQSL